MARLLHMILIAGAASLAIIYFHNISSFTDPPITCPSYSYLNHQQDDVVHPPPAGQTRIATGRESKNPTFYDDPTTQYTIDEPMIEWDRKRSQWFKLHPTFSPLENRVLVVTGSQMSPCNNPSGDNFLLRSFKNKVDYCRIHGYEIFYNNAVIHPNLGSHWSKLPLLRAAMVAHPETEWLFWVDSDAIFTDMDFQIPFHRCKDYNLVINGWPDMLYVNRSWLAVNAGVFLIRNCQWSMELLEAWAEMGPKSPKYKKWGEILQSTFTDLMFTKFGDQPALAYLIMKGEKKWREKIYVENEYALHGYWRLIVGKYEEFGREYGEMERRVAGLRRRHAEAVGGVYAAERVGYAAERGWRRPFVTHFVGCQPCNGDHNPEYNGVECTVGMERALNFADNQVLRNYGLVRPDIGNSTSPLAPFPFEYRSST